MSLVVRKLTIMTGPYIAMGRPVFLIEGECPLGGVDIVARDWAKDQEGIILEPHPPNLADGVAGLMARNTEMAESHPDYWVAFPNSKSKGTWDCLRKASNAGVPGRIYPLGNAAEQ
jgi:hypothetical protein